MDNKKENNCTDKEQKLISLAIKSGYDNWMQKEMYLYNPELSNKKATTPKSDGYIRKKYEK